MSDAEKENLLSREDRDTIGEMTNIAMGAAVSTLASLLGQEIDLSTPQVSDYSALADSPEPLPGADKIFVQVQYTQGLSSTTGFLLKVSDARRLAELVLGGDGVAQTPELSEVELGAVAEVMNQMMHAAATSMASVIHQSVEIDNPQVVPYQADTLAQQLPRLAEEPFTVVQFDLGFADNTRIALVQLLTTADAKSQVEQLLSLQPDQQPLSEAANPGAVMSEEFHEQEIDEIVVPRAGAQTAVATAPRSASGSKTMEVDPVTVRPVEFASFDHQPPVYGGENKNLELVMDVALSLTVELGKTEISIKDVLELTRGSVIELDRVAGEPVDLMANGKLIAKGEVVVIEDNFGLRITSIVSPADRLRGL